MSLTAYADADHAGCQDTRRSTSGSAQFIGDKLKALDDALVALVYRLEFGKYNMRLKTDIKPKEATFQVVLYAFALTPLYRSFLITTDVLVIYMQEDRSISRRNTMFWHITRDDTMFTSMKCITRPEKTQVYGAILPQELTNQDMFESEAYKTYYAFASRKKTPKQKIIRKKAYSDTSPKQKPVQATKGTRIKIKAKVAKSNKKKHPAKKPKDKGLVVLSESMVPDEQQQKTSGTDEGTDDVEYNDDDRDDNDKSDDERTKSDSDVIPNPNKTNVEHDKKKKNMMMNSILKKMKILMKNKMMSSPRSCIRM
nr:retrovirus-related Pol polyprotein from transposon TNT 1-94 [Tanacetum cinerariifolium]